MWRFTVSTSSLAWNAVSSIFASFPQTTPTDMSKDTMKQSDPVKYHPAWNLIVNAQGTLVPGRFRSRGTEGMVEAFGWARGKVSFGGFALDFG